MSPLLALIPGGAQAALMLKALGVTKQEEDALDSILNSAASLPVLRALPTDVVPKTAKELLTWLAGLRATGLTIPVPQGVMRVLDHPAIRAAVSGEVERYVEAHPRKTEIYSVIGKALAHVWPDIDIQKYSSFGSLLNDAVFDRILNPVIPSSVFSCRQCGFVQVVQPAPWLTCRNCKFIQQVNHHGSEAL